MWTKKKVGDVINVLVREKIASIDAVRRLYEGMLVSTLLYNSERN